MLKKASHKPSRAKVAVKLCQVFSSTNEKAERIIERYSNILTSSERRYCQSMFYSVVRNMRQIDEIIAFFVKKRPKPELKAHLQLAVSELFECKNSSKYPKIISFWVERVKSSLSLGESKLVNAVLRKVLDRRQWVLENGSLGQIYSHPEWLVERWCEAWGRDDAEKLLQWNQSIPSVFLRSRGDEMPACEGLEATQWAGFYQWCGREWKRVEPLLQSGLVYAQDPSTRLALDMLSVKPGERILDLCAAPGGKSLLIADALGAHPGSELLCVDKAAKRIGRLKENLKTCKFLNADRLKMIESDVHALDVNELGLFDAVLLDAPCSNTGVLRRRPDAKWRLTEKSMDDISKIQRALLQKASEFVKPGGRLVYSTCSIDSQENKEVVDGFCNEGLDFCLKQQHVALPWVEQHDGAGVALWERPSSVSE